MKVRDVPCDGCTKCCEGSDTVSLDKEDNFVLWNKYPDGEIPRPDGKCDLLKPDGSGCRYWFTRPMQCREFDCRLIAFQFDMLPRVDRRKIAKNRAYREILDRGRELLEKEHG